MRLNKAFNLITITLLCLLHIFVLISLAEDNTTENRFIDHGVAVSESSPQGIVATIDGEGKKVVLVWLFDNRGGYSLLMIDADSGKSEQFPTPFPPNGDTPYASILSSGNKYYTHFASHFVEFDPVKRAFTYYSKTTPQMAMGMTEDDKGIIWSVTYPQSGVVSFNPRTRKLMDFGHVYKQNWSQYQRYVVADTTGWIYFGIGNTASQIIAFDPKSGKTKSMLPESERMKGTAYVYRNANGKVYGRAQKDIGDWYEFFEGEGKNIGKHNPIITKTVITGTQNLFHRNFPDGSLLVDCDLANRLISVKDSKNGTINKSKFNYNSEGAMIMTVIAAPDGKICGGTAFPMRSFCYDPVKVLWANKESYGQWNTMVRQRGLIYIGGYGEGFLLEWDPSRKWLPTSKEQKSGNPQYLTAATPVINRPHRILAHSNGNHIILAGTPAYGYTGGGLLIWDKGSQKSTIINNKEIIADHSTMSLVELSDGKMLGGTTVQPGTGGEKKADAAQLYIFDVNKNKLEWHDVVLPGVIDYTDLSVNSNGLIYGIADRKRFFVFDPIKRKIVHENRFDAAYGLTPAQQGPRVLLRSSNGKIYVLLAKGIASIDNNTFKIGLIDTSPVAITSGGDITDNHIYFASGSNIYSYRIPD